MDKIIKTFRIDDKHEEVLRATSIRYDTGGRPSRIVLREIPGKEFVTHREYMDLLLVTETVNRSTPGGVFTVQNQRTVGVWVHESYDSGNYFMHDGGNGSQSRADALTKASLDFDERASRL